MYTWDAICSMMIPADVVRESTTGGTVFQDCRTAVYRMSSSVGCSPPALTARGDFDGRASEVCRVHSWGNLYVAASSCRHVVQLHNCCCCSPVQLLPPLLHCLPLGISGHPAAADGIVCADVARSSWK